MAVNQFFRRHDRRKSQTKGRLLRPISAFPALPFALTVLVAMVTPQIAHAAGGAYMVDDAEVGKPGECKVESWISLASNHDFSAVTSPACVAKLGVPIELTGQLQRSRNAGVWDTTGMVKAKTNLIPVTAHAFGLAIEGGGTLDFLTGNGNSGFITIPATYEFDDQFRINLNGGWMYDNIAKIHYLTWGAGFEWQFKKPFTLIGEVFGQQGNLAAPNENGVPASRSIREPRSQIGLRITPKDNIDFDFIWGHNVMGENAQWATFGVNLRF